MNGIPPMPRRVKKLPLTAARKVRMPKQAQSQQRKRDLRRMQSVARQQRNGDRQQPHNLAHAQRMFAEYLQHIATAARCPTPKRIRPTTSSGFDFSR